MLQQKRKRLDLRTDRLKKRAADLKTRKLRAREAAAQHEQKVKKLKRKFEDINERRKELKRQHVALREEENALAEERQKHAEKERKLKARDKEIMLKETSLQDRTKAWRETEEVCERIKEEFSKPEDRLGALSQCVNQQEIRARDLERKLAECKEEAKNKRAVINKARAIRMSTGAILKSGTRQQESLGKNEARTFSTESEGKLPPSADQTGSQTIRANSEKEKPFTAVPLLLIPSKRLNGMCEGSDRQVGDSRSALHNKNEDAQEQRHKESELEALSKGERAMVVEEGKAQKRLAEEYGEADLEGGCQEEARLAFERKDKMLHKEKQEQQQEMDTHTPMEPRTQYFSEECGQDIDWGQCGAKTQDKKERKQMRDANGLTRETPRARVRARAAPAKRASASQTAEEQWTGLRSAARTHNQ